MICRNEGTPPRKKWSFEMPEYDSHPERGAGLLLSMEHTLRTVLSQVGYTNLTEGPARALPEGRCPGGDRHLTLTRAGTSSGPRAPIMSCSFFYLHLVLKFWHRFALLCIFTYLAYSL
jgi:hypothetical protein